MSASAPVLRLPTVLLEEIFDSYVWDSWMNLLNFENQNDIGKDNPVCVVALVCRTWKAAAYDCPRLWNTVDLTRRERARFYLEKAKGVPLHVQWIPSPGRALTGVFPAKLLRRHAAMVESIEIVDTCENMLKLRKINFPILSKLSLADGRNTRMGGLGLWLPKGSPALQDLRLMGVQLERKKLISLLKECPGLRELHLLNIVYHEQTISLENTVDHISLPHLEAVVLKIEGEYPFLLPALQDVPKDCSITIYQFAGGFDVVDAMHWKTDAWRRIYPFRISHILFTESFIELRESSHPSRAPIDIILTRSILTILADNWPRIDDCLLKERKALDTVEVACRSACSLLKTLPPFKTVILHPQSAAECFVWLTERPFISKRLECVVLEDVRLATSGPVDFRWAASGYAGIPNPYQMLLGVEMLLQKRQDGGARLKRLVLREKTCKYDDDVVEYLRPFVDHIVIEPSHALPRVVYMSD